MELEKEQEEEKEKFEDQEFTYQNSIPKNLEIETPNLQTQQNLNLKNPEIGTLNIQTLPNQDNSNPEALQAIFYFLQDTQEENKAVTTYLGCFHRNLSILQHICLMHPVDFQAAVTNARDFEAAKLEANHAQAINLVMNESSDLDSKLKQLSNSLNQKLKNSISTKLSTDNTVIVSNPNDAAIILTFSLLVSSINLSTVVLTHLLATVSGNLSAPTKSNTVLVLILKWNPKAKTDTTKLEIINSSLSTDPHNILPATITKNESLDAIFLFKLEELLITPLFSGAALKEKPIMAMYTDAKVDGHPIKLILDSESAGNIITRQLMDQLGYQVDQAASAKIITADGTTKTPISKIDNLSIKINGIIVPIKVLVIEATQYQAQVGND
ncbi:hypothetical protein G9A89_020030 [Geosiphon pyriformis]|nr:hypothetical protein G9A89_020030 [Geosiphon pyriformis]